MTCLKKVNGFGQVAVAAILIVVVQSKVHSGSLDKRMHNLVYILPSSHLNHLLTPLSSIGTTGLRSSRKASGFVTVAARVQLKIARHL